jgi:hypothetical protein
MRSPSVLTFVLRLAEMQIELARIKLEADEMVLGKLMLSWHTSFGETGARKILIKHKVPRAHHFACRFPLTHKLHARTHARSFTADSLAGS